MTAEALAIEEVTGSERSIELRNRALPYRPASFPGEQRIKKSTYPGNPVSTIQVLGPNELPIELKGTWKSRYIDGDATLSGFPDLILPGIPLDAEILSAAFERLRVAGNQIEVSWGPVVRRGVITKFVPNFQRVEDIEWTLTIEPSQRGERVAPFVSLPSLPTIEINAALLALLDVFAGIPFFIPNVTGPLLAAEILAQNATLTLVSSLSSISGIPSISPSQFFSVATAAEAVRGASDTIRDLAADQSIEDFIPTATIADVLAAENWRRAASAAALVLAAEAMRAREAVRSRVADNVIATTVLRENQTLRDLALLYYGSSDAWTTIADFNGFVTSTPPAGTRVKVPERGYSATGTGSTI